GRPVADVRLAPRRLPAPGPARRAGRAVGAVRRADAVRGDSAVAGVEADRPAPGVRPLAYPAGQPADGAGGGQPRLEGALRRRYRADAGELRQDRDAADAPGIARLAGRGIRSAGLEPEGAAPAADEQHNLPAVVGPDGGAGSARP